MTDRPQLYPGHQHQWTEHNLAKPNLLRCDVCDLEMPRGVVEAYESTGALIAAIRDPDTSTLYRGMCRVELWSRKARGEDIPEDVL